jgi:hypothetical protein
MRLWNKGPAIWFPSRLGIVIGTVDRRWGESEFGAVRSDVGHKFRARARNLVIVSALGPRKGGREVECQ